MTNAEKLALQKHACHIRIGVIESTHSAKCGHPGGSLSIAEVLSFLYFREMRVDPANPAWPNRDRLVLSKGHAAPALYSALAERGFFPVDKETAAQIAPQSGINPSFTGQLMSGWVARKSAPFRI